MYNFPVVQVEQKLRMDSCFVTTGARLVVLAVFVEASWKRSRTGKGWRICILAFFLEHVPSDESSGQSSIPCTSPICNEQ